MLLVSEHAGSQSAADGGRSQGNKMEGSAKNVLVTVARMSEGRAARVCPARQSKQLVQSGQCWACRAYMMHAGRGGRDSEAGGGSPIALDKKATIGRSKPAHRSLGIPDCTGGGAQEREARLDGFCSLAACRLRDDGWSGEQEGGLWVFCGVRIGGLPGAQAIVPRGQWMTAPQKF